jgi:hypothetical protein
MTVTLDQAFLGGPGVCVPRCGSLGFLWCDLVMVSWGNHRARASFSVTWMLDCS